MTNFLLHHFIPNWRSPNEPGVRAAFGRLSGFIGLACNLLLFAAKLLIGTLSGSLSICADAMNNLSDASSAIVTLVGFKLAEKPPDADHPYGHARFEYLSGLAIAAMILLIGFELAKSSISKILAPTPILFSPALVVVILLSICVKLWLFLFNKKLGQIIDSATLLATAYDSRNDVLSTSAVFLAILVETISGFQIDGYMGFAVALFILRSSFSLAKETISPLLGENASPELRRLIIETIDSHPMVLGYHDLMVHDYGPGQRFASLHVEMDCREDPMLCHEIIDSLERACFCKHHVHLVIHYDPIMTGDPLLDALRQRVQQLLIDYDARLTMHDFRMVQGTENTNLIFDISLPEDLTKHKTQLKAYLNNALNSDSEVTYHTVITFDSAAFNLLEQEG